MLAMVRVVHILRVLAAVVRLALVLPVLRALATGVSVLVRGSLSRRVVPDVRLAFVGAVTGCPSGVVAVPPCTAVQRAKRRHTDTGTSFAAQF